MIDYVDSKKAAQLLGCRERYVAWLCARGKLVGAMKVGTRWKIPLTADARLAREKVADKLADSEELRDVPVDKRNEALRRLGAIKEFDKFAAYQAQQGRSLTGALLLFAASQKIPKRTFERWRAKYRDQGLIGLVDQRGGGRFIKEMITAEAFELFKSLYLGQRRLSVKTCWQIVNGINASENKDWKVPALPVMYRLKDQIPLGVRVLHREGLAAYEARCAPYIQTDPDSVQPGQVWVGDHNQFNCWIRDRGKWIRPWVTAWMDMRSRVIVGRHISSSPNQSTILLAMKGAIEEHGPPDSAKIDNGKDYDSEMWTGTTKARRRALRAGYLDEQMVAGIYAMMDIGVCFSIKYHPQSKPIERFFDTLDCQFSKTIPTYCGKDTERKPDYLNELLKSQKAISQACDLAGFTALVDRYIEAYNNSAHTGQGMDGRSPAEVLATRTSRRVMADGVLDLLMRVWSGELTVGKNGVQFKKIWYGQYDAELAAHQGKKVRVAYDPNDLRQVYVYDAATMKLITIAEQNRLIGYGTAVSEQDLRHAMHQKSRATKVARAYRDSRVTANMDLTDLAIKAMEDAGKKTTDEQPARTLRPVRTPLDGQVREHKKRETVKAVKKAAGAESVESVLDIDFSVLTPPDKYKGVKLFDDE